MAKVFVSGVAGFLEEGLREIVSYIKERGIKDFHYHIPLEIESKFTPKTWKECLM